MGYQYNLDLSREACKVEKEHDMIKKIMKDALSIFQTDFRYEQRYLHGDRPLPSTLPKPEVEPKKEAPPELSCFKKLRNQLAKMFHPDKDDSEEAEKFKEIQEAYEEGNFSKLINEAIENEVDINLTVSDTVKIKSLIDGQRAFIERQKNTAEWFWYYSRRTVSDRAQVWKAMEIKDIDFINWLNSNKVRISTLEAESIARRSACPVIKFEVKAPVPRKPRPQKIMLIES